MGTYNLKDPEDFDVVKTAAEDFYTSIGEVYCPYFREKIAFNAKGLRHLKFKSDEVARTQEDQYARLKLIKFAPTVISESRTLQGIRDVNQFEVQKTNNRWEKVLKHVTFYEFVAILENVRVKVIVKQVENQPKHFWGIRPYWKIDKANNRRILHNLVESDN